MLIECKGALKDTDRIKLESVTSTRPIISESGKRYNKFLMIVMCNSLKTIETWNEWRYQELKRLTKTISGKSLCLWCNRNNIDYVPVHLKNTIHFDKWLDKYVEKNARNKTNSL